MDVIEAFLLKEYAVVQVNGADLGYQLCGMPSE